MSIEELLRPRYKVIADYPGNIMPVGSIFWDDVESIEIITPTGSRSVQGSYPYRNKDKFPHLFKKLEWWEERKIEEMPEYIKFTNSRRVFKILKWRKWAGGWNMNNEIDGKDVTDGYASIEWHFYKEKSAPATAAEYEQYINKKEKQ